MGRDINDIHNNILDIFRKERLALPTHVQIDRALHMGQLDVFYEYSDQYAISQKLHDALSPFKTTYSFSKATSPNGTVTLPDDYVHLLNAYTITFNNTYGRADKNKIEFVADDEVIEAQSSQLRPVTATSPIGINNDGTIQIYPEQGHAGVVTYLKEPEAPVAAYTQSGRQLTYDAPNSTQLLWGEVYLNKVIAKAVGYLSQNLQAPDVQQFATQKDRELP